MKTETINSYIKQIIDALKEKVYVNIKEIEDNDSTVRGILNEPVSELRTSRLKKWLDKNRNLMDQNKDLVALQLAMLNYLSKYSEDAEDEIIDYEEIFELTVNDVLPFTNEHPLYCDDEFRNKLLNYYTEIEDYETCAKIFQK